ncbi:unnamed protein product, partial [Prorocentrum cordatum]
RRPGGARPTAGARRSGRGLAPPGAGAGMGQACVCGFFPSRTKGGAADDASSAVVSMPALDLSKVQTGGSASCSPAAQGAEQRLCRRHSAPCAVRAGLPSLRAAAGTDLGHAAAPPAGRPGGGSALEPLGPADAAASAGAGAPGEAPQASEASESEPVSEFTVTLDRTQPQGGATALGVDIDLSDREALVVDKASGDVVEAWNCAHPDLEMMEGDRILAVNGQGGDAAPLTELARTSHVVAMLAQRPGE